MRNTKDININGNGWSVYEKLVLFKLQELTTEVKELRDDQTKMRTDIAGLKIKSGIWGAIGGSLPICIGLIIWLFKAAM